MPTHDTHDMQPNTLRTCQGDAKACTKCYACTCHFPATLANVCKG